MNEKDYGTLPILKLFFKCSVPAMVGMAFSAIYSITDGIFVGHYIGHEALAAVNLIMPFVMIITALSDMIASGSSVRISILLGKDDDKAASTVFSVCLKLILAVSSILGLTGFLFADGLVRLLGADQTTASYATQYLRIFSLFMPLCSLYYSTDNYLRACGKVRLSMAINIFCSVLNIALDYVLIVVLKKGVLGAAFASCISMSVGAVWSVIPFLARRLPLVLTKGRIAFGELMMIMFNGSSEFFMSIAGSLFIIVVNVVLLKLGGSTAVAASSIVEYIESLFGMVIFSMAGAMQPAISYCFGARLFKRMKRVQLTVMMMAAILSFVAMIFLLFGGQLLLPFFIKDGDVELYGLAHRAMRIYALSYTVGWIDMTLSEYLTSLEKPLHSLSISLSGTCIFPLIALAVLVPIFKLDGVWMVNVVSGVLSAITAIVIASRVKVM